MRRFSPRRVLRVLGLLVLLALLAHVPWHAVRESIAVVSHIEVQGLRYLDPAIVQEAAGLAPGQDLFALDLARARQAVMLHPRVADARVTRRWLRGVRVEVTERTPVVLVPHGAPWEMDSAGVLLEPLQQGVVADVPLLLGAPVDRLEAGCLVHTDEVRRGLAWARELARRDLQLSGYVSEIDVSSERMTALVLTGGTRVLSPSWPEPKQLMALRVVLADLAHRGTLAEEVDLRFDGQVIVRPAGLRAPGTAHKT